MFFIPKSSVVTIWNRSSRTGDDVAVFPYGKGGKPLIKEAGTNEQANKSSAKSHSKKSWLNHVLMNLT